MIHSHAQHRPREAFFDNAKFLLIVLVVFGHSLSPLLSDQHTRFLYAFVYLFHMPLFAFVSGYFWKKYSLSQLLCRTIAPYMVFQVLYLTFLYFVLQQHHILLSLFTPYYLMWFLLSLFAWHLLVPLFQFRFALVFAIVIGILCGYIDAFGDFLSLSRTICFFPFFLFGHYLAQKKLPVMSRPTDLRIAASVLFCLALIIIYQVSAEINIDLIFSNSSYNHAGLSEWYAGIYRLLFYVTAIFLGGIFLLLVPRGKTFFTEMGGCTLSVYLLHGFVIKAGIILLSYQDLQIRSEWLLLTLFVVSITISVILSSPIFSRFAFAPYLLSAKFVSHYFRVEQPKSDHMQSIDVKNGSGLFPGNNSTNMLK